MIREQTQIDASNHEHALGWIRTAVVLTYISVIRAWPHIALTVIPSCCVVVVPENQVTAWY
jgi:hypothetical protein